MGWDSTSLTLRTPHADDEAVQLAAQEVAFLLELLDALLQPGVLLQSDVEVSAQVRDQHEGAVLRVRRLLHHWLCRRRKTREKTGKNEHKNFDIYIKLPVYEYVLYQEAKKFWPTYQRFKQGVKKYTFCRNVFGQWHVCSFASINQHHGFKIKQSGCDWSCFFLVFSQRI